MQRLLIIGFITGTFSILISYVMSRFANILVFNKFGIMNIVHLEAKASIILILINVFSAFISGLIPPFPAVSKDPVEALRSE